MLDRRRLRRDSAGGASSTGARILRSPLCILLLVAAGCFAGLASAANTVYLQQLQEEAERRQLATHPKWRALLHYRGTLDDSISELDAPFFFASPKGKWNPQAELDATLAAFFSDSLQAEKQEHPQCAFVARFRWLAKELRFDEKRLPRRNCERFTNWYERIQPHSLSVIFPAAYLNNPSSMFGHTLLRFDSAELTHQTSLLAYAVNYAATPGTDKGALFAVKGIVGAYPGYVSVMPYYEKVNAYAEIENRDIWEYQLQLTPEEVAQILEHVWELRGVYADYYFFSENCSYQLLTLLDVARPELDLAGQTRPWVIPTDTVRVIERAGLVARVDYRPSAATRLRAATDQLNEHEQQIAMDVARGTLAVDSPTLLQDADVDAAAVLSVAYEYQKYQVLAGNWPREEVIARTREILVARSKVQDAESERTLSTPEVRPDQGHGTALLALGAGQLDEQNALLLRVRPAYHDLLDPSPGYVEGAQIKFLDLNVAYLPDESTWLLDHFGFVDIISLSDRDLFFRPISWSVRSGWYRLPLPNKVDAHDLTFVLDGGGGLTHTSGKLRTYALIKGALDVNNDLENNVNVGPGFAAGLILSPMPRMKFGLAGEITHFALGEDYTRVRAQLDSRVHFGRNQQLQVSVEYADVQSNDMVDIKVAWNGFF